MNTYAKVEVNLFYEILFDCPFKETVGIQRGPDWLPSPGKPDSPGVAYTRGVIFLSKI